MLDHSEFFGSGSRRTAPYQSSVKRALVLYEVRGVTNRPLQSGLGCHVHVLRWIHAWELHSKEGCTSECKESEQSWALQKHAAKPSGTEPSGAGRQAFTSDDMPVSVTVIVSALSTGTVISSVDPTSSDLGGVKGEIASSASGNNMLRMIR